MLKESKELDNPLLSQDWVALSEHIGTNQITLKEYIYIDEGICTSEIKSIKDIIKYAKVISSCADDSERDTDEDMDNNEQQSSPIPSLTEIKCLQHIKQLCHKNFLFQLEIIVFIVSEIFFFLIKYTLFVYIHI